MMLNGKLFLHIVDTKAGLQNAVFIDYKSAKVFGFNHWASVQTVFPNIIRLDRETSFTLSEYRENSDNLGI